ncbi:hypothetical protein L7F22_055059 [Adiantum nelumboides]|nr:hypothetical protein [Adiantum nelumboides]
MLPQTMHLWRFLPRMVGGLRLTGSIAAIAGGGEDLASGLLIAGSPIAALRVSSLRKQGKSKLMRAVYFLRDGEGVHEAPAQLGFSIYGEFSVAEGFYIKVLALRSCLRLCRETSTAGASFNRVTKHDISNTPVLLKSRIDDENLQVVQKGVLAQLQEELANVKQMLAEKEAVVAESKRCMEKLWCNYCRKSKQNDEIILHNSQLYRDLTQARDQLKILQHENAQMSAVYKACKLEMQEKLNEALEQVDRLKKLVKASSHKQASDKQHPHPPSIVPGCSSCYEIIADNSDSIHSTSVLRKRERKSYKELSLKVKLRQANQGSTIETNNSLEIPQSADAKEVRTTVPVPAPCKLDVTRAVDNGPHIMAPQQAPEKGENMSKNVPTPSQELCDRTRRRAASSVGSYKEPSLKFKMRRAN